MSQELHVRIHNWMWFQSRFPLFSQQTGKQRLGSRLLQFLSFLSFAAVSVSVRKAFGERRLKRLPSLLPSVLPSPTCFPFFALFHLSFFFFFFRFFSSPLADLLFYLCVRLSPACPWRSRGGKRTLAGGRRWAWREGSAKDGVDLTEKAVWTVKEEGGRGGRKRDWCTDCIHTSTHATVRDEVQRFQEGKSRAVSRGRARCLLSN